MTVTKDLASIELSGPSGVAWSLRRGGDLNVNAVVLQPGDGIGEHVNDEVDVVIIVVSGTGTAVVDGGSCPLAPAHVVHIEKGARRSVEAGDGTPLVYVTVHRARQGPTITARTG